MKLQPFQIDHLIHKVLEAWRGKQLIHLLKPESQVIKKMEQIMTQELQLESRVHAEAEKIYAERCATQQEGIDKEKMLQLIKSQIVRERKLIL